MRKSTLTSIIGATMLSLSQAVFAGDVSGLTTFSAGTPARAAEVNGNFSAVKTAVDDNHARITANTQALAAKQERVGGACSAGSAIRQVNADGTVVCQNAGGTTGFASVSAVAGVPQMNPSLATSVSQNPTSLNAAQGRYASTGGRTYLVAPVALPHGATITSFTLTCYDNDPGDGSIIGNTGICEGYLYDGQFLMSVATSGEDATAYQTVTTNTFSPFTAPRQVVDNQNKAYYVYFSVNGAAGINHMPIRAVVGYSLP